MRLIGVVNFAFEASIMHGSSNGVGLGVEGPLHSIKVENPPPNYYNSFSPPNMDGHGALLSSSPYSECKRTKYTKKNLENEAMC
jgi:hypothetical protein